MRLVEGSGGVWRYERVGRWRGGRLRLAGGAAAVVERAAGHSATCSEPCAPGRYLIIVLNLSSLYFNGDTESTIVRL